MKPPLLGMIALLVGLVSGAHAAENNRADVLSADLAFIFTCSKGAQPPSPAKIDRFLVEQGFRVLDIVRLAQEQHVAYRSYTFNTLALDAGHRKITLVAFPAAPESYHVGLNSPPPTHHDAGLEDRLLAFAANDLGCEVNQVSRNENTEVSRPMHDDLIQRAEGWFKEADEMKRPQP